MYTIGIIKANHLLEEIFDSSALRSDNYFCELIGLSDDSSYNDLLALFKYKLTEAEKGIILGTSIPNPNDRSLIDSILSELGHMQIGRLVNEDIHLHSSTQVNEKIKRALDKVIQLASKREHFASVTIRNNFIAKLMIWCNLYTEGINFNEEVPPKCLFYGPIKKHEVYFLMLLAYIGMDVVYFNPTGDTLLSSIDEENLCQSITLGPVSSNLIPFETRVSSGIVIDKVTTYAKKATTELEQALYQDTGIYRPWQFSDGTTRPLIMDSVIEDTLTYWNEEARLRPGFRTSEKTVYTPCFFTKISGVYSDINAYYRLVQQLREAKYCIFYNSPHFTMRGFGQTQTIKYHNVSFNNTSQTSAQFNQQHLYSLAFCLNKDGTIKREQIKEHVLYQNMLTLRSDLQTFLLNKLEETFAVSNSSFFNFSITDKERVRLMASLFTADSELINLLDSYDFTGAIPKVIFYINSREPFNQDDALLLGFLRFVGVDIIILSPNGANNVELVISNKFINHIKLQEFVHDLELKSPNKTKKGSFFSKLFK